MKFKRFADFLKERGYTEASHANKEAMDFDAKMAAFHNRFPDGNGEEIIKGCGYQNIPQFLHDKNQGKWSRISTHIAKQHAKRI
jgi:hypothetical protein